MQALAEEIEAIKKGRGGSIITVYDGVFVRRDGPLFVYVFNTESPLIVMDDAPAEIQIGGQTVAGQIISVQGSEVAVGIENDFGATVAQAKLITNLWYLLEALRKRYEEILNGERTLDTRLGQRLFGFVPATTKTVDGELNLPASPSPPNDDQLAAIRAACGSDVHFIWGPPGTGKTQTIGFLIVALLRRNLRVLVVSHTNVATDHAIRNAANLLRDSEDYQSGRLVRFGNTSGHVNLPPMVIPKDIADRLGKELKEQLAKLQSDLQKIQAELKTLREIEAQLLRQKEAARKLAALDGNLRQSQRELEEAKSRASKLSTQLEHAEEKLAEAKSAGKLKRLVRGLNPAKLQVVVANLKGELAVVQNSMAAAAPNRAEILVAIDRAREEQQRCANEAQSLLSQHNLDVGGLSARICQLSKQAEESTAEVRAIEAELEEVSAKILRDAKVIATSLTKATISKQMDDQKFDAIVVDEASMAPMASLYFATGRASQKAIVVGDFRQLPPICISDDTEMAKKWLGRDIFAQAGIQSAVDKGKQEQRLTMLHRQYRMHPEIMRVTNSIFYNGRLTDNLGAEVLQNIGETLERSPFTRSPFIIYDVSSTNPWSSRLEQGGRYNLYSAVLSAELAKRAVQAGIKNIGIISPYSAHARLTKMIKDESGGSEELRRQLKSLQVSTVHRFQGLEEDVIIFDIGEGPMPRYGPSPLVDGWELESQAAKLINVSITRSKAQIVVVANLQYLASKLRSDAILIKVLNEIRRRNPVVDSTQVVDDYFCSEFERWATLLDPHDDRIDPDNSSLYTERNFYASFFADLRKATKDIIIVSPFLTANRAQHFFNIFASKLAEGVEIRVFTRTRREQEGDMFRQAEMVFDELTKIGVQVVERRGLHQKFAFIDRKVAWEGSLNILSQSEGRSTEHMRRLPFANTCKELIELHKFGSDTEVDPGSRRPIQTDRKCNGMNRDGQRCGATMILRRGPYSIFLGCGKYPECQNTLGVGWDDRVGTDVDCPGKDGVVCGRPMFAVRSRYGVYLKCFEPDCQCTRKIKA